MVWIPGPSLGAAVRLPDRVFHSANARRFASGLLQPSSCHFDRDFGSFAGGRLHRASSRLTSPASSVSSASRERWVHVVSGWVSGRVVSGWARCRRSAASRMASGGRSPGLVEPFSQVCRVSRSLCTSVSSVVSPGMVAARTAAACRRSSAPSALARASAAAAASSEGPSGPSGV